MMARLLRCALVGNEPGLLHYIPRATAPPTIFSPFGICFCASYVVLNQNNQEFVWTSRGTTGLKTKRKQTDGHRYWPWDTRDERGGRFTPSLCA
ncbi:hypothetical protein LY76DRAFT_225710 [Colletotrichum caudatum]|nr:hypothetical protein LY76DRAFT_225710 [Colletotrichum caudatum]